MTINILTISDGSKFIYKSVEYTLVIAADGGWNWKNEEGYYALLQNFYYGIEANPKSILTKAKSLTLEQVAYMAKHLS